MNQPDQPESPSPRTHSQNVFKKFGRSIIQLFRRSGRQSQEEPETATADNARIGGSDRRQASGREGGSGNGWSHAYMGPTTEGLPGMHQVVELESPSTAVTNPRIHVSNTRTQVPGRSNGQLPPDVMPAETGAASDVPHPSFFYKARNFDIHGNPTFRSSVTHVYAGRTDDLENLKGFVSFSALFDSKAQDPNRRCHPGTRINVLNKLGDWFNDCNAKERIFWLCGPAGSGKSAIAQTIAHEYKGSNVAATFFYFKSDIDRNDGNRLVPTLAYQLAFSIPTIRAHIANSLYERPDLPMAAIETQFEQLLARPFQALNADATQQLASVIIIDGIDECTDETLQERFLKIIDKAVTDSRFTLRFLIVSRPEHHIVQAINDFQTPIVTIDLATLDDANQDIEKYLLDKFAFIAHKRGLSPSWPGKKVISNFVDKSSGNFIFPSLVISFVGDQYSSAETQLDIVLKIVPPKTTSPFAVLDQLFLAILGRVPDQDFLKRYLALFAARIAVSSNWGDLHEDDPMLMHVSHKELHTNLLRLRSLLRFGYRIDVYHRSFIDFLHDSSRSSEYYIGEHIGARQYLGVLVDSLVRYVSIVIKQPDLHNTPHFTPRFRAMIRDFPPKIDLPANEWREAIQPLLDVQENLLRSPNFASNLHILRCDECTVFHLLREFLHLGLHQDIFKGQRHGSSVQSVMNARRYNGVITLTTISTESVDCKDLDGLFLSLLSKLPEIEENWSPSDAVINHMSDILKSDHSVVEIARRVLYVPYAQKLVDLLAYLIDEKFDHSKILPDTKRRATLLGLEIFARTPILPLSCFPTRNNKPYFDRLKYETVPLQVLSQTIMASRILDSRYIVPVLVADEGIGGVTLVRDDTDTDDLSIKEWRQRNPSSDKIMQIILGVAKAIQYFHSLGVTLHREFGSDDVYVDKLANLQPRIRCLCSTSRSFGKPWAEGFSPGDNILSFGLIFSQMYAGTETGQLFSSEGRKGPITSQTSAIKIPDYAWRLVQRCWSKNTGNRPTIDQIVREMESWNVG